MKNEQPYGLAVEHPDGSRTAWKTIVRGGTGPDAEVAEYLLNDQPVTREQFCAPARVGPEVVHPRFGDGRIQVEDGGRWRDLYPWEWVLHRQRSA